MAAVGTCTNVERCSKAIAGELIEMYPGLGEVCPQCGRRLTPVASAAPPPAALPAAPSGPPAVTGSSLPTPQFGFTPKYVSDRSGEARVATEPAAEKRPMPTTITGSAPPNAFVAPPDPVPAPAPAARLPEPPPLAASPQPQAGAPIPPPAAQAPPQPSAPWTITPPSAPPAEPEEPRPAQRQVPAAVLWGALALGLLAIGGGSYYLYRGSQSTAHAQAPAPPPPPAAAGAPAFALCTTFSLSDHLAPDLLRGFLTKMGGTAVGASSSGAIGQLAGKAGATRIDIKTSDAAGAFSNLISGSCEVAVTALPMSAAERTGSKTPIAEKILGQDGLVIVVNPSNPIQQLSIDQVKKIFTGEISNWSGVGGPSGPIEVILPNDNTDEMTAFRQMVLGGTNVSGASRRVGSLPDVSATVGHDRGSIGLVGFNASDPARVLRLASGDGSPIVASSLNIGQKRYPLTTTLYLYERGGSGGDLASQFAAFTQSDPGQALVTASSFVGRNSF